MMYLVLVAAMPWPPPQMPTEEQFKQIQKMGAPLQPSPAAPAETFADVPKAVNDKQLDDSLAAFKNAWFLGGKFFGKQQVEVDAFLLPSGATVKYVWTSAVGEGGKSLLKAAAAPAETLDGNGATIPLVDGDDEVTQAKAKVTLEVPSGYDEITVDCATKTPGKVAIERCDNDVFAVRVDGLEEGDLVLPLNKDKRALEVGESSRGPLFSGKTFDAITYEEFKKGPGDVGRVEGRARGVVAFVRWLRPKAARTKTFDIVATKEPSHEDYGPSSRVRFIAPVADAPAFASLTPPTFESGRSCAVFGYNAPQIVLVFPRTASALYARATLDKPKVKGAKGKYELAENGMDERTYRYKWTLEGEKFSFASVDVKAEVTYPKAVSVRDAGFEIKGHRVTMTLNEGEEIASEITVDGKKLPGLTAFDANGRALKQFGYSESNENGTTYAFMGQVKKVRAIVIGGTETKTVKGTLKPAPLRPKEKAGLCD